MGNPTEPTFTLPVTLPYCHLLTFTIYPYPHFWWIITLWHWSLFLSHDFSLQNKAFELRIHQFDNPVIKDLVFPMVLLDYDLIKMAATPTVTSSSNAFSMLATALAQFDGTLIMLVSIQECKHIIWINTDDDNNYLAAVNSRPAMLFTCSDGVDIASVPRYSATIW